MNNREKVFIILTPGFASSENDCTCLPMQQDFVKTISSLYTELRVIILSFHYPYHESCYPWFDATLISFGGQNKGGVARLLLRRKVNRFLNKLHEEQQIVGLLSFWLNECAAVGKKFGDRNNIPHYCWLLGQDARAQNKYAGRLGVRENELIALSDFLQEEFRRNYGIRPFAVVPPGIESQIITTGRDIDLLAAGSLIPLKQFDIFVEVVARIKEKIPRLKAMLIGEGPQKKVITNLATDFGVKDNIEFVGEIEHRNVLGMMKRAKVLLHPSSYEGYSGVCQEALSNGAHVISFCKAMNNEIDQWHIVRSKNEMVEKAMTLLQDATTTYQPVRFSSMAITAKQMMDLFLSRV